MDTRVVVGVAVATEETSVTASGVGTSSPILSTPSNAVTIANAVGTSSSSGGGGSGVGGVTVTPASTPCTAQKSVVVVASPSSNHQQPGGVVTAVPRILSRNVNGTCKSVA